MAQPLLIGVLCDDKLLGPHHFHSVGDKYVRAVSEVMGAIPLLIPVLGDDLKVKSLLTSLDGLLLPGSYSNIDPRHYGQENEEHEPLRDPLRDSSAFALIREAISIGVPLFAICRGFQEVNVALGGSLYQCVHTQEGMDDHREDKDLILEQQYADTHEVSLIEDGKLSALSRKRAVRVNSLHQQGIQQLGDNLRIEALAADGLVEAYSLLDDKQFLLGVQWHPEWKLLENPFNLSMFEMFKQACIEFKENR